ncbi:MAG: hypothetical protein H7249_13550 [Chitinophagaceae bacterium]|nr:hypothetical protein [Oligoflexus sp.]
MMDTSNLLLALARAKDSSNNNRYRILEHYLNISHLDEVLPSLPSKWLALVPESLKLTFSKNAKVSRQSKSLKSGSLHLSCGSKTFSLGSIQEIVPFSGKVATLQLKNASKLNYTNLSDRFVPFEAVSSKSPDLVSLLIVVTDGKSERCLTISAALCKLQSRESV